MRTYLCVFTLATCITYGVAYIGYLDLAVFSIEQPPFKLLFYLLVVLFGIELAMRSEQIMGARPWDIIGFVACAVAIYSHKLVIAWGVGLRIQFLQQIFMFPMLYYLLKIARSGFIIQRVMGHPVVGHVIRYVGVMTLEIYLVHGPLKDYLDAWPLPFPVNVVVLAVCTLILATLVRYLSSLILNNILTEDLRWSVRPGTWSGAGRRGD